MKSLDVEFDQTVALKWEANLEENNKIEELNSCVSL